MPGPKYVLHPGRVGSVTDGQVHFISAAKLAMLYKLRVGDYIISPPLEPYGAYCAFRRGTLTEGLVDLYPRYSGNYTLPILQEKLNGRS